MLTDVGRVAFRYADDIFSLGQELTNTIKGRPSHRPLRLVVGLAEVVPKNSGVQTSEIGISIAGTGSDCVLGRTVGKING